MRRIVRRIIKLMMNATYNFMYEMRIIRTKPNIPYLPVPAQSAFQLAFMGCFVSRNKWHRYVHIKHSNSRVKCYIHKVSFRDRSRCELLHKQSFVSCDYHKRSLFKTQRPLNFSSSRGTKYLQHGLTWATNPRLLFLILLCNHAQGFPVTKR